MNNPNPNPVGEMSLFEHLAELRSCLLWSMVALLVAAVCCYYFSTFTFAILTAPYFEAFAGAPLVGTGPAEAFMLKLKVALASGIFFASPFIFYQVWRFISPGLYAEEKRLVVPFVVSTSTLFIGGAAFCYYAVIPFAFAFFQAEYSSINVSPTIKISEHVSTMLQGMLAFGIVFELPVLAFFLARVGVITKQMLVDGTRLAIVIIVILSAVLTPPDVVSQLLMAAPLTALYFISIWIVGCVEKGKQIVQPENLS
jgi:sec-independent protein translocase protein TatC